MSLKFLIKSLALSTLILVALFWQQIFPSQTSAVIEETAINNRQEQTSETIDHQEAEWTDLGEDNTKRQQILDLYEEEQFAQALKLLRKELASIAEATSYQKWLHRQEPVLLTSIGWQLANQQRCDEAMYHFESALKLREDAFAIKGMGYCFYKRKDYWQAEPYLRRYIGMRPTLEYDSVLIMADTLESLQYYGNARDLLERATTQGGFTAEQDENLKRRLKSMTAKAREFDNQATIETDLVSLSYRNIEHEDLSGWVLTILEEAMDELSIDLGLPRPAKPLEVLLYPMKTFKAVSHGPSWATGLFDGRLRIPVADRRDASYLNHLKKTLRHELVHGVLTEATSGRSLPTWFHEGLATVMECPGMCSGKALPVNRSYFLPLKKLEGSFFGFPQAEVRQAYSQSYYLIRSILKLEGEAGLRILIEHARSSKIPDSKSLLAPLGASTGKVLRFAKESWQKGARL